MKIVKYTCLIHDIDVYSVEVETSADTPMQEVSDLALQAHDRFHREWIHSYAKVDTMYPDSMVTDEWKELK